MSSRTALRLVTPGTGDDRSAPDAAQLTGRALQDLIFAADQFRRDVAEHFGIRMVDVAIMSHLCTGGQMGPSRLSAKIGLKPSTMTPLLDRLAADGLVRRSAHPTDRRQSVIVPTERGAQLYEHLHRRLVDALGAPPDDQGLAQRAVIEDLVAGLQSQAAALRGGPAPEPDDTATP